MKKALTNQIAVLLAALTVAFGFALTAFAYDNLEIEIEVRDSDTRVVVEYLDGDEDVREVYEFETTNLDEVYDDLADELDLTTEEVADASKVEINDEEDDSDKEDSNDEDEEGDDSDKEDNSDEADAADAIEDAVEEIEKAEAVIADAAEDGKETELSSTTLADARGYLAKAEAAYEDEKYGDAEEYADKAEDLAQLARMKYIDKSESDVSDNDKVYICHEGKTKHVAEPSLKAHLDHGDTEGKCSDDDDKKDDKYKDYGKSDDVEELREQLRVLLELLITLLQAEMLQI